MERRLFLKKFLSVAVAMASVPFLMTETQAAVLPMTPNPLPEPEPAVLTPEDQAKLKREEAAYYRVYRVSCRCRRRHRQRRLVLGRRYRRYRVVRYRLIRYRPRRVYYY
jgi:hypothetical protein